MVDLVAPALIGTSIPEVDPSYYISPDIEALFERIDKMALVRTQKVLLKGPHGAGKTEMAIQFAARTRRPLLIMDCANLREARDWFGSKNIDGGRVVWNESLFVKALETGGHVLVLDEFTRGHQTVMNPLNPLLDGRGFTYVEEKGGVVRVGANTVFFATMNEGASYTGTHAIDAAMRDRWQRTIEVTYLPREQEVELLIRRAGVTSGDASALVDIANQIRKRSTGMGATFSDGFSTRQLIAAAEDYAIGGLPSLTFTMTNLFSADGGTTSERAAVLQLIQGKFGTGAEVTKARLGGR